ncbi:hypothetical protein PDE_01992 [Penicillium oxalicum 114-2]|uniref:Exonuclease domain-containing protein n=1 Tax=Penicillium oxalicum (strain 114-2 / CGMCC 5302) TaxID=933388 RepID=S7ZED2_PENO1|nr:hypothetical protein PDE_01992 [Penicillium oxalicum 114-2]
MQSFLSATELTHSSPSDTLDNHLNQENHRAEPGGISADSNPTSDVTSDGICEPLTPDESKRILICLRTHCHPKSRLIAWGIKVELDFEAEKRETGHFQKGASAPISCLSVDLFRMTPQPFPKAHHVFNQGAHQMPLRGTREAIAIDCEMVMCGNQSELAYLSAIDFLTGEILIDHHVQPKEKVTRWNTRWSGVSVQSMKAARRKGKVIYGWEKARERLWRYADQETVLIGHAIRNDLDALRIVHPRIVDTSILTNEAIFPDFSNKRLWSLKTLAREFLHRSIQTGRQGHSALEDSQATRDVLLWCLRDPERLSQWATRARASVTSRLDPIESNSLGIESRRNQSIPGQLSQALMVSRLSISADSGDDVKNPQ